MSAALFHALAIAGVCLSSAVLVGAAGYVVFPRIEKLLGGGFNDYVKWVLNTQERMFEPTNPRTVLLTIGAYTSVFTLLGFWLSHGYGLLTLFFTTFAFLVGYSVLKIWVTLRWHQRIRRFDQQLIDALTLMSNSLRSGLNLPQVIQILVEEMPKPISQEFGLVLSQQKLGLTIDEALEKLVERVPSDDLAVAIHAVLILRETGGDLSETFETIANTIRERRKVDGKIRAMTQQGRTQGGLLFAMPFGLALLLYYVNPGFLTPMFTTQLGWMMILVMLFFQVIGGLWIRKIVTIDV